MSDIRIINLIMHDGSRHFLCVPELIFPNALVERMQANPEFLVTQFLDGAVESWIDFDFRDWKFTINNQFGDYWFFAEDPDCPVEILAAIRDQFATILLPH
jgi:hypothetical protein